MFRKDEFASQIKEIKKEWAVWLFGRRHTAKKKIQVTGSCYYDRKV